MDKDHKHIFEAYCESNVDLPPLPPIPQPPRAPITKKGIVKKPIYMAYFEAESKGKSYLPGIIPFRAGEGRKPVHIGKEDSEKLIKSSTITQIAERVSKGQLVTITFLDTSTFDDEKDMLTNSDYHMRWVGSKDDGLGSSIDSDQLVNSKPITDWVDFSETSTGIAAMGEI